MNNINQPTKEQVRQYMVQRQIEQSPPPPIEEIRRQLGWGLLNMASLCSGTDNPVG